MGTTIGTDSELVAEALLTGSATLAELFEPVTDVGCGAVFDSSGFGLEPSAVLVVAGCACKDCPLKVGLATAKTALVAKIPAANNATKNIFFVDLFY